MVKQYVHRIGLATALVVSTTTNAFQPSVVVPSPSSSLSSSTTQWQQQRKGTAASQLFLLPEQGSQLAAAFHAACGKVEEANKEGERASQAVVVSKVTTINKKSSVMEGNTAPSTSTSSSSSTHSITPLSAARAFVARLFSLPSSRIRRHPHPKAEGFAEDFNKPPSDKVGEVTTNTAAATATATSNTKSEREESISKVGSNDGDDENSDDNISDQDDVVLYPMVGFTFVQSKADGSCTALPTTSHPYCRLPIANKQEEVYGWFTPGCELDMFSEDPCHEPFPVSNGMGDDAQEGQVMVDSTSSLN